MMNFSKLVVISLIVVTIGVPLAFREKNTSVIPIQDAETLVIITPHNEALRSEYTAGFKKWYKAKTGKNVNVDWRRQGGRDMARYIESICANNFRLYWTQELHREWNMKVASAFAARSEDKLNSSENSPEAEVSRAFFQSNVGCGIDILFGGGVFEIMLQGANGNLVPCKILQEHPEMFSADTIPEYFAGNRLWDEKGRWFGASLTTFGIFYNSEAIEEDGIGFFPETWDDIGRPEFFKKLAVVDPTKSSSTQTAFCMLLQQKMLMRHEALRTKLGLAELSAQDEAVAIADGWIDALHLLQKMVANGRYFTDSTTRPIVDVSLGNCLVGISVDFYGFAEAAHLERRSGSKRFKFTMPRNGGAPSPDPIGIFRGAPNPELAEKFLEFILSIDGQKLIDFKLNTPGGPEKLPMRRVPILKTIYESQYEQYRCDPTINPYESVGSFISHEEWTAHLSRPLSYIMKVAFIDLNSELSEAMGAIIRARREGRESEAARAYEILSDLSDLTIDMVALDIIPIISGKNILKNIALQNRISRKCRMQYLEAKRIADGLAFGK
ncbi:MAG: extracellular solute-binding protein [Puniceicoccales bacterium]|nr:extracellular solute-binding protein [Puniceicoccales bacterium]